MRNPPSNDNELLVRLNEVRLAMILSTQRTDYTQAILDLSADERDNKDNTGKVLQLV